jgi:penicillin-binding protein 2
MKTGPAFPDYIRTEKIRRRDKGFLRESYPMRILLITLLLAVAVGILFARLFFLQIIKGHYYRDLSDGNRIRTITIHAQRGIIFDRNGKPLVYNIPGFRQIVNGKTRLIENEEAMSLISSGKKDLEIDSLRSYAYKDIFAHVLGYIGQIFKEELSLPSFTNYKAGDLIGKMGIERKFERILKGIDGERLIEVDSQGKVVRKLGQKDSIPGNNVTLTLDSEMQKAVFAAMEGVKKGTAIVSSPTGEIWALVSKPSFDPNLFTLGDN